MIRILYPPMAVEKARRLAAAVNQVAGQKERDRLCQDTYGLSHRYLTRVGTVYRQPSNRTLDALGFDLILRDRETGRETKLPLILEETP